MRVCSFIDLIAGVESECNETKCQAGCCPNLGYCEEVMPGVPDVLDCKCNNGVKAPPGVCP